MRKSETVHRRALLAGAPVVALGLGGCLESADVTVHEPGKYKGSADPLLDESSRDEVLEKRFQLVQVDR
ncbi:MAG: hypothetical protein ACR2RL_21105 [Gammaproteobacteria bacterium]